ncbi:hypothetical protein MAE02_53850 [Microvirga aerophila]|uniref:Uncharacterized protein n=1 Tax=Microvirga aerophila TaxID=670291 RepID=A0A512C0F1_9HYPH|nr:hypothetical protein MAE02_53850 [Microvirga aerophila]
MPEADAPGQQRSIRPSLQGALSRFAEDSLYHMLQLHESHPANAW